MANYKKHSQFNLFLALPVLLAAAHYLWHPPLLYLSVFSGTFIYSTLFMSPDVDLAHQIKLFSLRGLLTLPFRVYSMIFRHRGISHSFFFGSLTRIFWLAGFGLLIFYGIYETFPNKKSFYLFYRQHRIFLLYSFAGICFADWCHLLLDRKK